MRNYGTLSQHRPTFRTGVSNRFLKTTLLLFLLAFNVSGQLLTQDFNFTGNLTSNGWTAHSGGGTNPIATTTGLAYSGHAGSGVGNAALINNLGGEDDNITFTSQSTNGASVYASFLCNVTDAATSKAGDYFFHLGSPGGASWTAYSARVFARIVSGSVNFGLSNTSTATYGTTNFSRNTTYLIVIKYTIATGTTADPVSMWVLPSGLPATEFSAGVAEVANTTTNGTDAINAVGLRQGSATASPQIVVDAIRTGTTWTSVVPSSGSAPSLQTSNITFGTQTASTVTVSWSAGNGDGRLVKINTTNSFTDPTSGATYTANATYSGSGEQVVSVGASNSATVSGLTAGQTYYFRAYEYSNTGTLYNTTTATGNPSSVTIGYPSPVSSSISPSSAIAGGSSFTLTVSGSNFYPASVINWNGVPKATTFVNSTTLTATIGVADIATPGTASVTVVNPLPGGGTSLTQVFTINASVAPLITVSASLSNFIAVAGTPSSSQSYQVSGTNLTDDITIVPPTGFEIRTGSNAFSTSSVVLVQAGGVIPPTTIDVRMNVVSTGTVTGSVAHTSNGASSQLLSLTGFALSAEPTTPSTVSIGTITGNSIVVNTSGGSGSSRIIVVRSGSTVTYFPADGVATTGVNSDFGAAADQGSGNKIVYDGSGTSVTVSNLAASTAYYFTVYEYDGSGVTANYLTSGAGTANATTLAAEPTSAATLSLTRMKTDSTFIGLSGGNGSGRMIVLSTSPVSFVPADGNTYSGASTNLPSATDLGSGNYLVFSGSPAATLSLTGLNAGTTYYIRSYEYNGTGTSTNYRTSTYGGTTFTTPSNISYTAGLVYTQNFNGLPSAGTTGMTGFGLGPYYLSTPAVNATSLNGWQHTLVGGTSTDVVFAVDNGVSTSGGVKSYGATGSTNRALGSLATGSSVPCFGAIFVNNTGGPLTTFTISYTGQQWRNGGSGTPNQLAFSYALNGSSITNGSFNSAPSLSFNNPVSGGASAPLDGTLPANQSAVSATVNIGTNWMPGQTLVIRWTDNNDAGNDEGIAIDDFTFSAAGPQTPASQDSLITFSNIQTTSMDVFWQPGSGTSRLLAINTSNSFTDPADGNTYTSSSTYFGTGQQFVYDGQASVVHVDGLTAGTTYYFRAYGYNGTGSSTKYSTVTAQDNPSSQSTVAPSLATQLVVVSVNGGADPITGVPFSVVVRAQDGLGNIQTVNANTTVALSIYPGYGYGTLSGTLTGVIPAGSSTVTFTGITYSPEENYVQLQAATTAGQSLTTGVSNSFNVLGVANQLVISSQPSFGVVSQPVGNLQVQAYRNDFTLDNNYNGTVTLSKFSGPGTLSGTLSVNCVNGIADFAGVVFSQAGTYELMASATGLSSAYSTPIVITLTPTFTELVVPKYLAGKTSASLHNARVPFAVCLKIDNLFPNTAYDIKAGVGTDTTANTSYGSGNIWTGTTWAASNITAAFTTDANGSSGPFWVYIQPTANSTNNRFAAGQAHNLRIGYAVSGGAMPTSPVFVGTKIITGLDVATTPYSTTTTDDGAFVKGTSSSCIGGKYILFFNNTAGTGDPISVYQSRTMAAPNTVSQSELPTVINDVFLQTSTNPVGDYGAAVPTGSNNPSGVQRIEVRNADNTLFNVITDSDGNWGTGANTTTLLRRDVALLTPSLANLNTISVSATAAPETCTGALDGSATATASSSYAPISYSWNTTPVQSTATATALSSGIYTVTVSDANGCTATATTTVNPPAGATVTANGPTTFCSGGSVTLTAGSASGYIWSNGQTTQSIVVTTSGSYSVTVSTGNCIATSIPITVAVNNYEYSGTLFTENMGTPTGTVSVNSYAGWQNTSPISFNAGTTGTDVRTTTVSSGYTGASGGGNLFFGTSGGNAKTLLISGINTNGYTSLSLSFGLLRTDLNNAMTLEVSSDGINFSPLTITQPIAANTYQLITVNNGIPSASNLRIRFSKNATTSFRLDDIKITGTTTTPSITAAGPTAVCGSGSVVLSANVATGILWSFNGSTSRNVTVSAPGSYTFTATGTNGCTATSTPVNFVVNPEPTATISAGTISCNGGSAVIAVSAAGGTAPYSNTGNFTVTAGTYSYIVTDINGCDDTVSTTISQPAAITGTANVSACGSYTWTFNGNTYSQSGSYSSTVAAANGCDSTATLNLTITPSTNSTTTASACDSYVWSLNGTTYTQSGTYSVVNGCDTKYLSLTITPSSTSTSTASACDSYVWSLNGNTYTQSGTYSSVNGCDTRILALTITPTVDTTTTMTACGSYTWSVNGTTYTQSGSYSSVIGCRTDRLSLTITTCTTGITLDLIAYIQAYYSGSNTMTSVLYNGGVAGATTDQADTILIELRDSANPALTIDQASVVLMTDGSASADFNLANAGTSYWIVLKHHNAIQTWSADAVMMAAVTSYDFSTSDTQAFGNNLAEVETGVWAIYSGDINQDEFIDSFDYPSLESDNFNFATGYYYTDINGDGFVDSFDYPTLEANNFNFVQSVHP